MECEELLLMLQTNKNDAPNYMFHFGEFPSCANHFKHNQFEWSKKFFHLICYSSFAIDIHLFSVAIIVAVVAIVENKGRVALVC